jgi:tripartite-type tricarboxylate transporter receptor subunit TctC
MKKFLWIAFATALAGSAAAQAPYPSRPITMVVGFARGGGTDTASRIIAKKFGENLGQSVLVENKAGAGGNIATELVVKAAPDGYTILLASVVGHIKAGRLRALATTGAQRSPAMPEVPTIAESGYPGYEATNWYAYVAPAKTPKEILVRLNQELVTVLAAPEVREQLIRHGLEPQPGTAEALAKYMEREYATWGRVVKEAKITAN